MAAIRVQDRPDGPTFELAISGPEEASLLSIPARLEQLLLDPDGGKRIMARLFPMAFPTNPTEETAHRLLIGNCLFAERLENLREFGRILERRVQQSRRMRKVQVLKLSCAEVKLFVHVINDLRLLLGTHLDITENEWHTRLPDSPEDTTLFIHLARLTDLQADLLQALCTG